MIKPNLPCSRRSWAAVVFLLTITSSSPHHLASAQSNDRVARRMPLSLFEQLLYTASTEDNSPVTEEEWQAHADLNWARARELDETEGRAYPFILCDDDSDANSGADAAAITRRRQFAALGLGLDPAEVTAMEAQDAETDGAADNSTTTTALDEYLDDNLEVIRNDPSYTCVMGSFNGTRAAFLPFIVQPISFLMKINSGSVGFVPPQEYNDGVLQYAVNWCKGPANNGQIDQAFVLSLLQDVVPLIPLLIQVPEAAVFEDELVLLKAILDDQADFCDELLIQNVVATNEGGDDGGGIEYTILTFNVEAAFADREDAAHVCFSLLTFALAYAPEVCYIERRVQFETSNYEASWVTQSSVPEFTPFYQAGITGQGQVVAFSDTGLDLQSCYFRDSEAINYGRGSDPTRRKVIQYFDYVNRNEARDGHGSHVGGTIAGRRSDNGVTPDDGFVDGVAYNAQLAFVDIGEDNPQGSLSVPGARTLMNPGRDAGAKVHSASWGSNSLFYTSMDEDIDAYLFDNKGFLMIVAAGNEGPVSNTIRSPAGAKNVLTVGATRNEGALGELASFSSIGPAFDGRIKPDVVAPGQWVLSVGSRDNPSCDPPSESDLPGDGEGMRSDEYGILSLQGTSMATPVVSGVAAMIAEYFAEGFHGNGTQGSEEPMELSGALLKAILINGARPLNGYALNEVDFRQGFGRASMIDSLPLAGHNDLSGNYLDYQIVRQGEVNEYDYEISSNETCAKDAEFSVTLVWTDAEGTVACRKCLLTDLDLFVVQTKVDGSKVNHYPNGKDVKDDLNNVERIRFLASPGETFDISVRGAFLNSKFQFYSLAVISGCGDHRLDENYGASSGFRSGTFLAILLSVVAMLSLSPW